MYTLFIDSLILQGIIWPLLLAILLFSKNIHNVLLVFASWAALPAMLAAILVVPSSLHWDFPWLLLGSKFGLDTTGQIFLLFSSLLWGISGIYAKAYFTNKEQQIRFYRFFLPAMAGNFGLIVAQDIFTFYLFFTLMSFASYGLVVFKGDKEVFRAGFVYIAMVIIGEVILFSAFLMLAQTSEATTFDALREGFLSHPKKDLILFFLLIGFGIKAGVIGLHVWLPLAHPAAPTPASAVLSGAMIKAGLLGWIRLLPLGENSLLGWAIAIIILGLIAQLYGVIVGLTQKNPKALLAYSSISQMGIMTMLIGLGMFAPDAWQIILPGISFFALHHGLSKGALFLGVGMLGGEDKWKRVCIWIGIWVPALTLAGAPWSSGMIAKYLAKGYCYYAEGPWNSILEVFLVIGSINTALLMLKLLYLVKPNSTFGEKPSFSLVYPWVILLCIIIVVPFLFTSSFDEVEKINIFDSLWPLFVSIFVAAIVYKKRMFEHTKLIPAGDILIFYEKSITFIWTSFKLASSLFTFFIYIKHLAQRSILEFMVSVEKKLKHFEHKLTSWEIVIFLFVGIICMTILFTFFDFFKN